VKEEKRLTHNICLLRFGLEAKMTTQIATHINEKMNHSYNHIQPPTKSSEAVFIVRRTFNMK
jgi:hypothetical protein